MIRYWGKIDIKSEEFSLNWLTSFLLQLDNTDQTRTVANQSWTLEGLEEPDWSLLRALKWNIRKTNTDALSKTGGWFFLPHWEADAMFKNLFTAQVVQFNLQHKLGSSVTCQEPSVKVRLQPPLENESGLLFYLPNHAGVLSHGKLEAVQGILGNGQSAL